MGNTGVFDKNNGGGFLDEIYPTAAKAIWDFEGIYCSSRHIPHVKFPGLIHPGILGCAPSPEVSPPHLLYDYTTKILIRF